MAELAEKLGLHTPMICENGAFVAVPENVELPLKQKADEQRCGYEIYYLGSSRKEVLVALSELRAESDRYKFQGYADWSVEEVAQHTNLGLEQARNSKERMGTEPIHWRGTEDDFTAFQKRIEEKGFRITLGGRFFHVSGQFNKASGVQFLAKHYAASFPEIAWETVALGDSPNDLEMLNKVDIGVVIPHHTRLEPTTTRVIRATEPGPTGWNQVMLSLLAELSI